MHTHTCTPAPMSVSLSCQMFIHTFLHMCVRVYVYFSILKGPSLCVCVSVILCRLTEHVACLAACLLV